MTDGSSVQHDGYGYSGDFYGRKRGEVVLQVETTRVISKIFMSLLGVRSKYLTRVDLVF